MNNKKYKIVAIVLSILTVIMTSVGLTFAYFSNKMEGTPANVKVETSKIGGVVFDGGSDFANSQELEPGWKSSKTFKITVAPSDFSQTVYVKMDYTSGLPDLQCEVLNIADGAKGNVAIPATGDKTTVILVEKTFEPSSEVQEITYTMNMEFLETGIDQSASQGKAFDGELYAEIANSDYYYNDQNPTGTDEKPKR